MSTNQRGLLVFFGLLVFAGIFCVAIPFSVLPSMDAAPAIPVIQVPGEILIYEWEPLGIQMGEDWNLINTMVAMVLADLVVLLLAVLGWRASKGWRNEIPGRFQGMMEVITGGLNSLCKNIGGQETANKIFPLVASIFFFLLAANWMSIFPGVESIGNFHCAYPNGNGYPALQVSETSLLRGDGAYQLVNSDPLNGGDPVTLEEYVDCVESTGIGAIHGKNLKAAKEAGLIEVHDGHAVVSVPDNPGAPELLEGHLFHITPFVRPAATDLNLTIGLALVSFVVIQFFGFQSQGLNYIQKFIPIHSLGNLSKKPLGAIDLIVGPLEFISELSKIVSLSFRLFGNIFAGAILLAVMIFLVGSGTPVIFYALELIVGLAQALVFAVLTLVFVAQAMQGHHGDEHDEH